MVVSSPWPVWTTVSSGSVEQPGADRLDDQVAVAVGAAGRAGAALEQGVAGEDAAEVGRQQAHRARRVTRACGAPSTTTRRPGRRSRRRGRRPRAGRGGSAPTAAGRRGAAGSAHSTASRSAGATRTWSSCACVQTIARHAALPDDGQDVVDRVRRVDHHALVVVADHPDVVVDVVRLAVEAEGAAGDGVVEPQTPSRR